MHHCHLLTLTIALTLLSGCERLYERAGLPNPAKMEAEGRAIGSACRHAGRGLEDCFTLNPNAPKAAIFEGWKEMNEYMMKHNMQAMPPQFESPALRKLAKKTQPLEPEGEEADAESHTAKNDDKAASNGGKSDKSPAQPKAQDDHAS